MKQSEHREKTDKSVDGCKIDDAEDRKIVIMWVKRIAVAVMVMLFTWTNISLSNYISRKTTY